MTKNNSYVTCNGFYLARSLSKRTQVNDITPNEFISFIVQKTQKEKEESKVKIMYSSEKHIREEVE